MTINRTIYVDVATDVNLPLRILMANAMTDPMKVPNWKIAILSVYVSGTDGCIADELKHTPENTKHLSLVFFQRITHHDFSLSRPEEACCNPLNGTTEDEKPSCTLCLMAVREYVLDRVLAKKI